MVDTERKGYGQSIMRQANLRMILSLLKMYKEDGPFSSLTLGILPVVGFLGAPPWSPADLASAANLAISSIPNCMVILYYIADSNRTFNGFRRPIAKSVEITRLDRP